MIRYTYTQAFFQDPELYIPLCPQGGHALSIAVHKLMRVTPRCTSFSYLIPLSFYEPYTFLSLSKLSSNNNSHVTYAQLIYAPCCDAC